MTKKSDDTFDLDGAAVDEELVPPSEGTLRALARKGKRSPGFVLIPTQIAARMTDATKAERAVIWCLVELEYAAEKKRQPSPLSNVMLERFDVSCGSKLPVLNRLRSRGILTYTQPPGKGSVQVLVRPNFWD